MKPDHEAAKRYAAYIGDMARDHVCGQDDVNLSAAYRDAAAQLDEALALLERAQECITPKYAGGTRACDEVLSGIRAFLAKHRKTGA